MRVSGRIAAIGTLAVLCVSGVARAEPPLSPDDLAGRWVETQRPLTFDLSRCSAGWCGVLVADGTCGRTALRLDDGRADGGYVDAGGRLELAAATQAYAVRASLTRKEDGTLALQMIGNTGDKFEAWRRQFPFTAVFARKGDATCRPDAKTS